MHDPADQTRPDPTRPDPTGLVDLAARRLGGMVLAANDEFFAAKENLLEPLPPVFDPLAYSDRGKVMDGWETRRRRDPSGDPGHDWCIVRLGVTGVIDAVLVDTSHFRGNFPAAFELWGTLTDGGPPGDDADWVQLRPRTELRGDAAQRFDVDAPLRVSHVRFVIHPDGGVARLRLLGRPLVDLRRAADHSGRLDLAAIINGGRAVGCSDAFFSAPTNLLMVGDGRDMGDGWETTRRRGPGHDFAIVELATTGRVERIELDTTNFKGNHPDRCDVLAIDAADADPAELPTDGWTPLVLDHPMQPHARHVIDVEEPTVATHLQLRIHPDGGVARLRARGFVTDEGWQRSTVALLDAATDDRAREVLLACCGSTAWVDAMLARRPFGRPSRLLGAADACWTNVGPDDVLEALSAHPRIGERSASRWSTREQADARAGEQAILDRIAEGNRLYEERFGHVFLIRAAGRSAEEILDALEERLDHPHQTEIAVAAEEQRQITALRLQALLREGVPG
ncbi:Allantoicase [Euzebya pacifica]|uniref:Probable allantoicase n=1 Tax=Euzebya pacifica TaxID=1608957 RepID=A0A346Y1E7_9ACTN|nr:allantoicase [Euzebya pacifica]AXV08294.1 Allantoicase [Euzebya pacifica]